MSLQATITEATRELLAAIREETAADAAPAVLWAELGEHSEAFAVRCIQALGHRSLVLAIVPTGMKVVDGIRAVPLPQKHFAVLHPSRPARFRVLKGGRGGGKSWSVARILVCMMMERPISVLCCREIQSSIRSSVHKLLSYQIRALGLSEYFEVDVRAIRGKNGSTCDFEGLFANISRIKSFEGCDICWVAEGASISAASWELLEPTLRQAGSFFVCDYNPDQTTDPTHIMFSIAPRPDALVTHTNYLDNPYVTQPLINAANFMKSVDDDAYRHVWLGECRSHSDAQILKGKIVVDDFEPKAEWAGPYFGLDFGFSSDPLAAVRCYIHEHVLYIAAEVWQVGCELDAMPRALDGLGPDARRHTMRADSASPANISYLQRHGFPGAAACAKWAGSIEDGISHLRSYRQIVISPKCEHAIEEGRLYSYKVDKLTGAVLPEVVGKFDHIWDAVRYALGNLIKMTSNADQWIEYTKRQNAKAQGEAPAEAAKSADVQHPSQMFLKNVAPAVASKMLARVGATAISTTDLFGHG